MSEQMKQLNEMLDKVVEKFFSDLNENVKDMTNQVKTLKQPPLGAQAKQAISNLKLSLDHLCLTSDEAERVSKIKVELPEFETHSSRVNAGGLRRDRKGEIL